MAENYTKHQSRVACSCCRRLDFTLAVTLNSPTRSGS